MTQAEATALATSLNATITAAGAGNLVVYRVFEYWDAQFEKKYNVVLFPKTHDNKFETANSSQKLAFARVSMKAQITSPFAASFADFNTKFETQKTADSELNNYLKP